MFIVEVIPLTLLPSSVPQILSYFFDLELQRGVIVEISLNKRKVLAVVLSSSSLEKEKLALKKVDFQIKKLTKIIYGNPQISDYQLKIAAWIAKYYHAPLGYTLKTILPPFALKKKYPLATKNQVIHPERSREGSQRASASYGVHIPTSQVLGVGHRPLLGNSVGYPQLLIYKTKRLVKHLESIIRDAIQGTGPPSLKSYGEAKQVLIVVSEKTSINYFSEYLSCPASSPPLIPLRDWRSADKLGAGSKKYKVSVIFSGMSNEKLYDVWNKAQSGETNMIIGTRQALNMHFENLGLIIVNDPSHEFYKSDMVPRYNAVKLAQKVAELNGAQLVLTSVMPSVEDYYKAKNGLYDLRNVEPRPKFNMEIIDMTQEVKSGNWSPISNKLNEELIAHLRENKRILIFSPRRGYAGILICSNCGSAINCSQCEVAMRTHRSVEMILTCHHCNLSRPMPNNCPICGSYNLKTVGPAGTQKIYDEIRFKISSAGLQAPVLVLDSDVVKNEVEEEEVVSEIQRSKPSVLIATQMVFSYRFYLNFDLIAVVNADALTNMPDFRSEENLFYQMEKLINFEPKKLLVQTYNPENKVLKKAMQGDYADFYDSELKLRETFNYPPFYKLIKLTFRHKYKVKASFTARVTTEKLKMAIARMRAGEDIKIIEATPAYIEKERGLYVYNIFLKVRESYQNINDLLKYAGPGWIIDVEPRSLL